MELDGDVVVEGLVHHPHPPNALGQAVHRLACSRQPLSNPEHESCIIAECPFIKDGQGSSAHHTPADPG